MRQCAAAQEPRHNVTLLQALSWPHVRLGTALDALENHLSTQWIEGLNIMVVKRVAVIGLGPGGAIAIDALARENAFDVIRVFERREAPGGCW